MFGTGDCIKCMEDVASVIEARSVQPLSFAFWYCPHHTFGILQWERRAWYVSWDWSCCLIQSLASWYLTACCRTMILSISMVGAGVNLELLMRSHMHWDSTWIPSSGCCCKSDTSSSLWAHKCSSDFIEVTITSNASLGVSMCSGVMTWLSIRFWKAFLSSPLNMSFSCFQPLWDSSATSGSMLRVSE